MSNAAVDGECKFAYQVHGSETLVRGLFEHGDGRWSIATDNRRVAEEFRKTRPMKAEDTFDMDHLIATAVRRFCGDRSIVDDDPQYARRLAAGVLMFAAALKILDMEESGQ